MAALLLAACVAIPAFAQPVVSTPVVVNAPCPGLRIQLNEWSRLPEPAGAPLAYVGNFAERACTFVGITADGEVLSSTDAESWHQVWNPGSGSPNGVVTEELAPGTAFVLRSPEPTVPSLEDPSQESSGLYLSVDYGASFAPVDDFAGLAVTALAAAPNDPQVLYAAADPVGAGAGAMFKSTDYGRSWAPLPGSVPFRAATLAVDASSPSVVWAAADGPTGGLWSSTDGGATFIRARTESVSDLDSAPLQGGGARLDAATNEGIVRTRDQGDSFRLVRTDGALTALSHEKFAPTALMGVVGGVPTRSSDDGRDFKQIGGGIGPTGSCEATGLSRNTEFPSYFLLSLEGCAARGHYLYRSDGRDLMGVTQIGGEGLGGSLIAGRKPRTQMEVIRTLPLAYPDDGTSGSLTFDGKYLYFTNNADSSVINMMTTEGDAAGQLRVPSDFDVRSLTYDRPRHSLWMAVSLPGTGYAHMYRLDLNTKRLVFEFESSFDKETSLTFDPTLGHFRSYEHHGYGVYEFDMDGSPVNECQVPGAPVDPNVSTSPDRSHPESSAPGFASGVAVGYGNMYLQLEDDRTIYQVTRECELVRVFEHRTFAESRGGTSNFENDQLVCDTVTFGRPAIWIRDAATRTVFAYSVPNGFCPIDSELTFTPPMVEVKEGARAQVCATLHELSGWGRGGPIADAELGFFVSGVPIGSALTDAGGKACIDHVPSEGPGTYLQLEAMFYGNVSYLGSRAVGILGITALPPTPPLPPRPLPPPPAPAFIVPLVAPNPVPPPEMPAQPPNPQNQFQPQQQPQAQAQTSMATQEQEQPQLALAAAIKKTQARYAAELAMSRRRAPTHPFPAHIVVMAFMTMVASGFVLAREKALARVPVGWRRRR